ncbi:peptidase'insulinase-like peptidase' [Cryptosporidium canis]|uniref:Peptidase'insulinase-like peptidase n=1 Tax=Cryptosporidium canis TaxID=195482 RepID=A0ABQ8P9V1_9CRYT|nr:peptidase'insulinase-like peptidase' [Cryptosporidium canis]KAJ1613951.1 peptidase'insulinase-like peptidase' [Cryptosporidium canis]
MSHIRPEIVRRVDNFILPESEDRKYRALELRNGLTAFLVSDKETKISGCCLTVNIGAMYSPKNLSGLAHFLEHMLFCGTKKYPDVDEYQKFIANHGGKRQGSTTRSTTTYYFEIKNDAFGEALDRFSSFFTEPLFCKEMTEKEVSAIENEFHLKYHSDERVRFHLLAQLADKSHPLHCFTTGNKETLDTRPKELGINLHSELLSFYSSYYSSNIMSVILYAKEDLDTLENYLVEYFSKVPNHQVNCLDYARIFVETPPYTRETSIGKMVRLIPYETDKRLKIYFPLPPLYKYGDSCAPAYICHIIGHKGEGGISSTLRSKNLAISASFTITNDDPCALAQFGIVLTDQGYDNIDQILEVVFNFLALLKLTPIIPELVDEFIGVTRTGFTFQPKFSIRDLFSLPTKYLKYKCNLEEILSSGCLVKEFSESDVFSILEYINHDNYFVLLSSQAIEEDFKRNPENFLVEHYYGTKYSVTELSADLLSAVSSSSPEKALQLGLSLPKPNPFVSTDFTIVNPQIECTNDYSRTPELLSFDTLNEENKTGENEADTPSLSIWFKPDSTFNSPHSLINMRLVAERILDFSKDPEFKELSSSSNELIFQVFGEVLTQVLNRSLHELSSDILGASLSYSINFNARTSVFVLQGIGLSHKLDYLVSIMFEHLYSRTEVKKYYEEALSIIDKDWTNKIIKPNLVSFSLECISESISPFFFNRQEKLDILRLFNFELFCHIRRHFLANCRLEGLIMGNFLEASAKSISIKYWRNLIELQKSLSTERRVSGVKVQPFSIVRLEENVYTLSYSPNPSDKNGCWMLSFFLGEFNLRKQVTCDLILPFITSEIFAELRTNQQLAYVVRATQVFTSPAIIIGYYLQSSEYTNGLTLERLLEFHLNKTKKELRSKLSTEMFNKLKDSTIQTLSSSPKSIFDEHKTYLHEINERSYLFDVRQRKIEILNQLEYKDLIDFYDGFWDSKSILTEIRSQIDSSKNAGQDSEYVEPHIPADYLKLESISQISRDREAPMIFLDTQL